MKVKRGGMHNATQKTKAPMTQKMPSTPPARAESKTARPSARKIEAKPAPQPAPQNVSRKKGIPR